MNAEYTMIDTTDHNAASEYARMLGVLLACFGLLCGIQEISATDGANGAIWLTGLSVAVGLRSLGPIGSGFGQTCFTGAVLLALVVALLIFRGSLTGVLSATMLFVIGFKLVTEAQSPASGSTGSSQA